MPFRVKLVKNKAAWWNFVMAYSFKGADCSCAMLRTLAFLLIAVSLQACVSRSGEGPMRPASRDTLRIAVGSEPTTLNPIHVQIVSESYFEEAIFDGLLKLDPTGHPLPDLAAAVPSRANGGISADLRTITYHLRHGVVWQDGVPFTSRDVAFTYRLHVNPNETSTEYSLYKQIAKLETPDAYTVRIWLRKPSVAALTDLFAGIGGQIVPEHVLASVRNLRRAPFNSLPIGTGPYRLVKWERGNEIELVANPRYFGGAPHIPKLTFVFVPSSATRALLLEGNEVDVAGIEPSGVAQLRTNRSIAIVRGRTFDVFFVEFNTEQRPLDSKAVRRGLAYALNRQQVLKGLNGSGESAETLLPSESWAFDAKNGCPGFDPRRADALLAAVQPLQLDIAYVASPTMEDVAVKLQQQWRAAGVKTELRPRSLDALFGVAGILEKGSFQVAIDEDRLPEPTDLSEVLASTRKPPQGFNSARYTNQDVDGWLSEAQATDDLQARRALYAQVQRAVCRDVPIIPLYWDVRFYGVNRALRNFVPNIITSDLWNVASWRWE
jgi:peptide/nickel transport system substrate-binding protein